MKVMMISLTAAGIAAVGLWSLERQSSEVDFTQMTGAINSDATAPSGGMQPRPKTERLTAQLLPPVEPSAQSTGAAALVMTQTLPNEAAAETSETSARSGEPLIAQAPSSSTPPLQRPENSTAQRGNSQPAVVVDESALRYFAARGDTARLQAEISRLRSLYPTWTPPADPLAVRTNGDPQLENMWQLYAQSRFADVRKAIADRQVAESGWQAPDDLIERLKLAEARVSLTGASDRKDYDVVIRMAAENPSLLTCSEIDVLWRVAEAFAETERQGRARDAYLYVLDNCEDTAARVATVQKASELLPSAMLEDLLAKEKVPAGGQPEFESLRNDLARRFISEAGDDAKLVVGQQYVTRLEQLAEREGLASDALLLGWYAYRRDNLGGAERWFRSAYDKEETASAAEGLALTLVRQKSPLEAENVLYRFRESSEGTKAAYLSAVANLLALDPPPVLQEEVLARMAPVVIAERDADAAQQFGWYARAMRQLPTAAEWFGAALAWKSDDEPSAYGLALTRNDLGNRAGVAALQRAWGGRSERIANLGRPSIAAAEEGAGYRRQPPLPSVRPANRTAEAYPPQQDEQPYREPAQRSVQQPRPQRTAALEQPLDVQPSARRSPRSAQASSGPPSGGCALRELRQTDPDQALSRGWCLMDLNRPLEAVKAFEVASNSASDVVRSDASYGRSLAYLRAGLTDQASVAAAAAKQTNSRAVELQSAILANRAQSSFSLGRYREALIALDQRAQITPEQTDLMILRGYAYLNVGRTPDARRIFQALASTGNRDGQRALAELIWPPDN
jgi:tetratricopeptide (TPR) repeat protein